MTCHGEKIGGIKSGKAITNHHQRINEMQYKQVFAQLPGRLRKLLETRERVNVAGEKEVGEWTLKNN